MAEILFVIVMMFCLIAGFFVFSAGAEKLHGYMVLTGLGIVGLILLAYYIKTPLPEYKLKSSYDLFDGKTFIGCKTDDGLVNITLETGRSDITIDGYKWDKYESIGHSGVINWGTRTRWELSLKGAKE
jgi:hypothetical protein